MISAAFSAVFVISAPDHFKTQSSHQVPSAVTVVSSVYSSRTLWALVSLVM